MTVHYLVYVSQARSGLDPGDFDEILFTSRRNNPKRAITGMLLFAEGRNRGSGSFMQLLKGAEPQIKSLRDRIFADPRHHTKIVLECSARPARNWADRSMDFKTATRSDPVGHPGFAELGETEFASRCSAGRGAGALSFRPEFCEDAA